MEGANMRVVERRHGAGFPFKPLLEVRIGGDVFATAIGDFAMRYADQAERDYQEFMSAAQAGRIQLDTSVNK